jgi:DNA-binding transcriptional ArsR family regulator
MPSRLAVAHQLSELLSVLSHPNRIRIVEELRHGERNVNGISEFLGISQSGASQHLAALRARNLVRERRDGRMVFYSLPHPHAADWLLDAVTLLESLAEDSVTAGKNAREARAAWRSNSPESSSSEGTGNTPEVGSQAKSSAAVEGDR